MTPATTPPLTPTELFQAGRLKEAIEAQTAKVRTKPADQPARFFLFELFLFAGDIDRARKQLDVLRYDDPRHSAAVEQYRQALESETKRRAVMAGTEQPKGLITAPDHVRLRLEALPYLARGEFAEAKKRLDEANAALPTVTGTLNGKPFVGLADADDRFGTVIEVFGSGGIYSWVPLEQIESINLNPPKHPRDVMYRPAHLVIKDGPEGDVLLPGLYPASFEHADEAVRVGRATDWLGADDEPTRGAGGKVFMSGDAPSEFVRWLDVVPS